MPEFPVHLKDEPGGERWEYAPGKEIYRTHRKDECKSEHCVLHNPSDHHMRDWPLVWRELSMISINMGFERTCPHGIGHPDPDCGSISSIHGCDGCCAPPELDDANV